MTPNDVHWSVIGGFWASIVVAIIAVSATIINYLFFRSRVDPHVIVYVTHDDRRPSIILLIIENIGKSVAKDVRGSMRLAIILFGLLTLLSSIGCVFPVQQSGMISSYPSGADLYLSEEHSTKESYIGKTPTNVSLVSDRLYQWKIKASHKDYEPLTWFVHGGKDIDHHFAFLDMSKEMLLALQEKFKPYGFDVIDFVNFAKSNLKTRGEVNFGSIAPDIDFRTFKDNNYVEVRITYLVTYNTLRVSMYEAASMTFDEVVKKLAKKIVSDFKKQDSIRGFIFNITYSDMDFLAKGNTLRLVRNEFILPKEACQKYAALEITNQDLINQSIVLVDGERIALNLQISK